MAMVSDSMVNSMVNDVDRKMPPFVRQILSYGNLAVLITVLSIPGVVQRLAELTLAIRPVGTTDNHNRCENHNVNSSNRVRKYVLC